MTDAVLVRRTLIVLAIVAVALLFYRMSGLFLLIFAAIVFATIFSAMRSLITRVTGLKNGGLALFAAVLAVFGILFGVFYLFGTQISREFDEIQQRLPEALASAQAQLDRLGLGERVRDLWTQASGDLAGVIRRAGGYALSAGSGIADFVLVLVGGIFLAVNPDLYRRGIVMLVPKGAERVTATALEDSAKALGLWLRAQLVSTAAIALLTFTGLWLLGVPAALGLALIAGLLDFIPFIGPIIAAVPAVLLAFLAGPSTVLWTIGLYLLVQQIQGNILQPLVQKHAVDVPPAVLLFAVAGAGVLFGILGVLLAAPLTVVGYVLVQRLYVKEALGKDIRIAVEDVREEEAEQGVQLLGDLNPSTGKVRARRKRR